MWGWEGGDSHNFNSYLATHEYIKLGLRERGREIIERGRERWEEGYKLTQYLEHIS